MPENYEFTDAEVFFDMHGETVTYTDSNGASKKIKAVIDYDVIPEGFDAAVVEPRTEVALLYSDVREPLRGATIKTVSDTFTIDAVLRNDRVIVSVIVK